MSPKIYIFDFFLGLLLPLGLFFPSLPFFLLSLSFFLISLFSSPPLFSVFFSLTFLSSLVSLYVASFFFFSSGLPAFFHLNLYFQCYDFVLRFFHQIFWFDLKFYLIFHYFLDCLHILYCFYLHDPLRY